MARRRAEGERGFIITLELVLIFTILGIGLLVGIVAIRNALFVWWQKKQSQTVWVYDSSDPVQVLGPARDFDEHEAPRLFYIDREFADLDPADPPPAGVDPSWQGRNFRAFLGVRDDRFTSRHRLFYASPDCSGFAACIAGPGEEGDDNRAVGSPTVGEAGGIGSIYPLQQGPSYGIGADLTNVVGVDPLDGFPGALYRSSATQCEDTTIESLLSYWESQRVGYPCTPFAFEISGPISCPAGQRDNPGCTTDPPGNPLCQPTPAECMCPPDYYRVNGQSGGGSGNNCCPIGTVFQQGTGTCRGVGGLQEAVPVDLFNGIEWTLPFRVNLPPDPSSWELLAPGPGGEGSPGVPTGIPYEGSGPFDFNVPPAGGESDPP
jgi:hypothetical protein